MTLLFEVDGHQCPEGWSGVPYYSSMVWFDPKKDDESDVIQLVTKLESSDADEAELLDEARDRDD
jgi:hypothetical protein